MHHLPRERLGIHHKELEAAKKGIWSNGALSRRHRTLIPDKTNIAWIESRTVRLSRLSGRHDEGGMYGDNAALSFSNEGLTQGGKVQLQVSLLAAFVELVIVFCQGGGVGSRWAN